MKSALILACALSLLSAPAFADKKAKGKSHRDGSHAVVTCPPGLAKKSPACVPPGQARKVVPEQDDTVILRIGDRYYRVGDRLVEPGYHLVTRPALYGLEPLYDGTRYVIVGDNLLRVNGDTLALLALVRLVDRILD